MAEGLDSYNRLRDCKDVDALDSILDDIGLVNDIVKRLAFLYAEMGVRGTRHCGDIKPDIQYQLAKELFVSRAWVGMSVDDRSVRNKRK